MLPKIILSKMKIEAELTLRTHWKPLAAFTGFWHPEHGKQVSESELLPGELSAVTFKVGRYTVRSAQRVYQIHEPGYIPEMETPASSEDVELVRKNIVPVNAGPQVSFAMTTGIGFQPWRDKLRVTHEISARHQDNPSGTFTMICRAAEARNYTWTEHIGTICAAKEHIAVPDKRASLFVCSTYVGDSFSVDTWYKLDPTGKITTLSLHPYDSDIDKARFS